MLTWHGWRPRRGRHQAWGKGRPPAVPVSIGTCSRGRGNSGAAPPLSTVTPWCAWPPAISPEITGTTHGRVWNGPVKSPHITKTPHQLALKSQAQCTVGCRMVPSNHHIITKTPHQLALKSQAQCTVGTWSGVEWSCQITTYNKNSPIHFLQHSTAKREGLFKVEMWDKAMPICPPTPTTPLIFKFCLALLLVDLVQRGWGGGGGLKTKHFVLFCYWILTRDSPFENQNSP